MNSINKESLLQLSDTYSEGKLVGNEISPKADSRSLNQIWNQLSDEVPFLAHRSLPRYFAQLGLFDVLRRRDKPASQASPFLVEDAKRVVESHTLMLQAESVAVEFVQALKPWGAVDPDRIIWHFFRKPFLHVAYLGQPFDFASDTLWESLDNQGYESVTNDERTATRFDVTIRGIPSLVKQTVQADAGWKYAVEHDLSITGPKYAIQQPNWCRFADLINPFALLISFWQTQCFVFDIPNEEDAALRLYVRR